MEEKYRKYKGFNWSGDQKWQQYYSNIVPAPPMKQLEKIKRKWYQKNIDKDFDITFNPESASTSSSVAGAGTAPRQQANNFAHQFQNDPVVRHNLMPDKVPSMKGAQYMTWVLFFVSCLLMKNRGMAGIGALVAGIVRRCGVPKFNQEFL